MLQKIVIRNAIPKFRKKLILTENEVLFNAQKKFKLLLK